jgi:hypothetical protein
VRRCAGPAGPLVFAMAMRRVLVLTASRLRLAGSARWSSAAAICSSVYSPQRTIAWTAVRTPWNGEGWTTSV